jgi:hypothetical protein
MHDAIGDDFSAIVIPADLPEHMPGGDARRSREVVMTYGNSMILFSLSTPSYTAS